jgi:hypothetical protein
MNTLFSHVSGDCLHTKTGSFLLSDITSFDVDEKAPQVTLHFLDKSTKVLNEMLPISVIHRMRSASTMNSMKQDKKTPPPTAPKCPLRTFYKISGSIESLSSLCVDLLQQSKFQQHPFIQLMKVNDVQYLLILIQEDLIQDSFATQYDVVVTKCLKKRYVEQDELQYFVPFSFNTVSQKTFNLAFLLREDVTTQQIQEIVEAIIEQFGPSMYFQLIDADWGQNALHVLFPYNGDISEEQKNIWFRKCHKIGRDGKHTVHSDISSVWRDLSDTRNVYDMNYKFHYNTVPIRRNEDKPIAYPDSDLSTVVSISAQFFTVSDFEKIAERIKAKFSDAHLLLFKNPAPLEGLDLVITIEQRPGVDLFAFEQIVKDLNYNLNNFHIGVPSHQQSNKFRIVKSFKLNSQY